MCTVSYILKTMNTKANLSFLNKVFTLGDIVWRIFHMLSFLIPDLWYKLSFRKKLLIILIFCLPSLSNQFFMYTFFLIFVFIR